MSATDLADLIAGAHRVSVIGLAKNTGKTRTLVALLAELCRRGRTVGLTSVGRDGETADVVDPRIPKPRIPLPPGGLVATSEPLLRAAGVPYEVLRRAGYSTPLGQTVIARLPAGGATEVAGPSSNRGTAEVTAAMREHGADVVLVDGAINRRAASAPAVADLVVLATGAALHTDFAQVVEQTVAAVEVFALPRSDDPAVHDAAATATGSVAITDSGAVVPVDRALTLGGTGTDLRRLFAGPDGLRHVVLGGALCESFAEDVRRAARGRKVSLVTADSSKVFLSRRTSDWYRRQNVSIEVLEPTVLAAISVNPVAPMSHRFDSVALRAELSDRLPGMYLCDLGPHAD
ncbi:hypothetical protein OG792_20295 [Micromonospora sp. NBC_01699]|uniref:lysine 5,6-aminomutase reactivase subunit KamB n=1 Tax=Micromonospora sp. NBC_01699 TaxID=2975984 RepID=UPI002E2873B1|nr:hypothetical protein [Micromonospora sp. NBC_01699]